MFKDHLVGEEQIADYLLFWMNQNDEYGYVPALGLKAPSDNIKEVLFHVAQQRNLKLRVRTTDSSILPQISTTPCDKLTIISVGVTGAYRDYPDFKSASQVFLSRFRRKEFGQIILDKDLIKQKSG